MECSEDLHNKLECSFSTPKNVSPEHYKDISFNWLGDCPIQKDGLCMLHAQKGEEYLPKICRLYPRSLKRINDAYIACCSSSCEAVVEMLYDNDFEIVTEELNEEPSIELCLDESYNKKLDDCYNILKDPSVSLEKSIENVCLYVNKELFTEEYHKDINPVEHALNLLNRFSDSDNFLTDINNEIRNRYINNLNQFEIDKVNFEDKYPIWMEFFEDVINNSLMYEAFPFVDKRFDPTNAFKGLCATYGLLRLVCIGYTAIHDGKDALIDATAELFHLIDHTAFYYNVNVVCNDAAVLLKI